MASFVVKKKSSGKGWRLLQQIWKDGERKELTIPTEGYTALGFHVFMTEAEAKSRVRQLNAEKRLEIKKAAAAARRVLVEEPLIESAFLPPELVSEFSSWLKNTTLGSEKTERKYQKCWSVAKRIIADLQIEPHAYTDNRRLFYRALIQRKYSPDHARTMLRILNQWGQFVCRKQGRFFEKIPPPKGMEREKLAEANEGSKHYRAGGSAPLTLERLKKLKEHVSEEQYRWLYISLWFGLRPEEVDALRDRRLQWRIEEDAGTKYLWLYQPKLVALPKPRRWKAIPVLYAEQKKALEFIEEGSFKRPLTKTLKKYLELDQVSCYAGRKGFTDLMLDRGQKLEDISVWMGHTTIERTWKSYKDRQKSRFNKAE